MESTVLHERAERFVDAKDPMAILGIPGCVPIAQNRAHREAFAQDVDDLPCVQTVQEYVDIVQRHLMDLERLLSQALRCYCDTRDAVLALRAEECVFEFCFKLFGRFRNHREGSFRGFEFLYKRDRVYSVWRAHTRLLGTVEVGDQKREIGLIETRLVEAKDLFMAVEGSRKSGLSAWLQTASGEVLAPITPLPPDDAHSMYVCFEHDLEESLRCPGRELALLRATADKFSHEPFLYPALQSIIGRLAVMRGGAALKHELQTIRERLWDGPLAANAARPQLERQIAAGSLELENIGRLQMPLQELESEDLFVGMVR